MDLENLISEQFGGNDSAFARFAGVTHGAVWHWKRYGMTPQREAHIEALLSKRSQAPVTPAGDSSAPN